MPDLGGTPQRKKINLSRSKADAKPAEDSAAGKQGPPARTTRRPPASPPKPMPVRTTLLEDDDDEEEDDDEIIQASLQSAGNKKMDPKIFGLICVGVVVLVVMLFLLLGGKGKDNTPDQPAPEQPTTTEPEKFGDDNLGIQDFTQNTTMQSTSPLTDPNGFVEDLYGLTTRVDYTVTAIQSNVVDFVNYTKKRGTWGGGLELYYLDATYKGNQYVVQVPFQYYKELDDEGIVPVKMEVLFVKQPNGETLSIISYMSLDEATLKTLLKSKK